MNKLALILLTTLPALPALADGNGVALVPSPFSDQAAFTSRETRGQENGTTDGQLVAVGTDGARLVVAEAAVITASLGARLSVPPTTKEPTAPSVTLLEGGFRIHVGSTTIRIDIGERHTIEVTQAELLVTRLGQAWLVQVNSLFDEGQAILRRMALPPVQSHGEIATDEITVAADAVPIPDPKVMETVTLEPDSPFVAATDRMPSPARARGRRYLNTILDRLTVEQSGQPLEVIEVEDPADLQTARGDRESALGEIEIEEIEIEAGCVEICVD